MSARWILALPLVLSGCFLGDSDADGLANWREGHFDADPENPDTDGDGMLDGDEVDAKTEPAVWDTDGDSYSDFQEIDAGTDPLDPDSYVYEGYWPYNPYKDDMDEVDVDDRVSVGEQVGRFILIDQFGQEVDLYDMAKHGKPIMLDVSGHNCGPCRSMARWMDGRQVQGYPDRWDVVRESVASGDLIWVTLLYKTYGFAAADPEHAADWYDDYPTENVPVLAVPDRDVKDHLGSQFTPSLYLLDEDMILLAKPSPQTWAPAMEEAVLLLNAE